MDIINMWGMGATELEDDINIIKTWLVGGSEGQTYPINERFLARLKYDNKKYGWFDFGSIEEKWDSIIGYKYDYKLNDPNLETTAIKIRKELMEFIEDMNNNPDSYFKKNVTKTDDDDGLWVVTYLETNDGEYRFGNVNGHIFHSKDEAWLVALHDAEEYSKYNGYSNRVDKAHYRIDAIGEINEMWPSTLMCRWEVQKVSWAK